MIGEPTMMTTLINMMPELLAFFGILALGLLGMHVSKQTEEKVRKA